MNRSFVKLHTVPSDTDKMLAFSFAFNGNMYALKWIISLISADGEIITPPMIHELLSCEIRITPDGDTVISFSIEILDDLLESMVQKKIPYYIESQRVYHFKIGFVDQKVADSAPGFGPDMLLISDSISMAAADSDAKNHRASPSRRRKMCPFTFKATA